MDPVRLLTYHAGNCAICDTVLERGDSVQSVHMHVLGPAGTVTLRCWLCGDCRPTRDGIGATSGILADRILRWYRADPSLWPTLHLSANG